MIRKLILFTLLLPPVAARADEARDLAQGHLLAEQHCGGCHEILASAHAGTTSSVPNFSTIARSNATSQQSLEQFLSQPHGMPDQSLSPSEEDLIVGYILSLRPRSAAP